MHVPETTYLVAEDLALAVFQRTGKAPEVTETRVRAVRRALDSLWRRGLVDKFVTTSAGSEANVRTGYLTWRIHDPERAPEPEESTRDAYGQLATD